MRRQAVHEERVLVCLIHQRLVDLIGLEDVVATRLVLLVHRHPRIGDDDISAGDRPFGVVAEHDLAAIVAGPVEELVMRLGAHWHGHVHFVAEPRRAFDERVQHVVAVTRPGDGLAFDRTAMLLEGHQVGHDLAGMGIVGQRVDNRHGGVLGHFPHAVVIGGADHDRIDIARQDTCRIADRLGAAELHFRAGQEERLAAELAHADIEGDAGAGGRLFENHCQHLAGERLVSLAGLEGLLAAFRVVENGAKILRRNRRKIQEMLW